MDFEQRQVMRGVFANLDHNAIAVEALDPDTFIANAEIEIRRLISSEVDAVYADENIMQRIVDLLGDEDMIKNTDLSAFFGGTLLALAVADVLARIKLGDVAKYRERWLSKTDIFFASSATANETVDVYAAAASTHVLETEVAYDDAVEKIAPFLVKEEVQAELFYAGFAHALMSAKTCIVELVQEAIDAEIKSIKWDFEELFKEK